MHDSFQLETIKQVCCNLGIPSVIRGKKGKAIHTHDDKCKLPEPHACANGHVPSCTQNECTSETTLECVPCKDFYVISSGKVKKICLPPGTGDLCLKDSLSLSDDLFVRHLHFQGGQIITNSFKIFAERITGKVLVRGDPESFLNDKLGRNGSDVFIGAKEWDICKAKLTSQGQDGADGTAQKKNGQRGGNAGELTLISSKCLPLHKFQLDFEGGNGGDGFCYESTDLPTVNQLPGNGGSGGKGFTRGGNGGKGGCLIVDNSALNVELTTTLDCYNTGRGGDGGDSRFRQGDGGNGGEMVFIGTGLQVGAGLDLKLQTGRGGNGWQGGDGGELLLRDNMLGSNMVAGIGSVGGNMGDITLLTGNGGDGVVQGGRSGDIALRNLESGDNSVSGIGIVNAVGGTISVRTGQGGCASNGNGGSSGCIQFKNKSGSTRTVSGVGVVAGDTFTGTIGNVTVSTGAGGRACNGNGGNSGNIEFENTSVQLGTVSGIGAAAQSVGNATIGNVAVSTGAGGQACNGNGGNSGNIEFQNTSGLAGTVSGIGAAAQVVANATIGNVAVSTGPGGQACNGNGGNSGNIDFQNSSGGFGTVSGIGAAAQADGDATIGNVAVSTGRGGQACNGNGGNSGKIQFQNRSANNGTVAGIGAAADSRSFAAMGDVTLNTRTGGDACGGIGGNSGSIQLENSSGNNGTVAGIGAGASREAVVEIGHVTVETATGGEGSCDGGNSGSIEFGNSSTDSGAVSGIGAAARDLNSSATSGDLIVRTGTGGRASAGKGGNSGSIKFENSSESSGTVAGIGAATEQALVSTGSITACTGDGGQARSANGGNSGSIKFKNSSEDFGAVSGVGSAARGGSAQTGDVTVKTGAGGQARGGNGGNSGSIELQNSGSNEDIAVSGIGAAAAGATDASAETGDVTVSTGAGAQAYGGNGGNSGSIMFENSSDSSDTVFGIGAIARQGIATVGHVHLQTNGAGSACGGNGGDSGRIFFSTQGQGVLGIGAVATAEGTATVDDIRVTTGYGGESCGGDAGTGGHIVFFNCRGMVDALAGVGAVANDNGSIATTSDILLCTGSGGKSYCGRGGNSGNVIFESLEGDVQGIGIFQDQGTATIGQVRGKTGNGGTSKFHVCKISKEKCKIKDSKRVWIALDCLDGGNAGEFCLGASGQDITIPDSATVHTGNGGDGADSPCGISGDGGNGGDVLRQLTNTFNTVLGRDGRGGRGLAAGNDGENGKILPQRAQGCPFTE